MKKLITAAVLAGAMTLGSANAALIDFANDADTVGERGLTSGDPITIDGVNLILSASGSDGNALFPYLDESLDGGFGNPAGLGVCRLLDDNAQCDDTGDDSIDGDGDLIETITIAFADGPIDIDGISFRNGAHNLINDSDLLVNFVVSGGADATSGTDSFANVVALFAAGLDDVTSLSFSFAGAQGSDFYIESLTVPVPGALPLLLSGIAGLGLAGRRKRAA